MILRLRSIVIVTVTAFLILFCLGVVLSLEWPPTWNFMLESFALNIVASLIGVIGSILVAIFIVEKYLEHERRQSREQQALQEAKYQERWQAYIHGGVSVLSAIITHLSLFVAYGRVMYLQLIEARCDTSDVSNSVGEFVPWLINNLQVNRTHPKEEISPDSTDTVRSQGMGEREASRLAKAFKDRPSSPITCSRNDLNVLSHYLRSFASHMRDQTLLFQPFLARRMEFGVALVQLAHSLDDEGEYLEQLLAHAASADKRTTPFELGREFTYRYRSLGQQAIKTINLMWAFGKDLSAEPPN